ncbi:LuxR C-terminal-related transcriptional regulator [Kibdelosporangium banguiense]|uniref:LuxR C-terminal-related transcriptional regulator n=1 Tax=Kibdelosporangium banguiense TaxID=1365924 RepID=UPI001AE6172F
MSPAGGPQRTACPRRWRAWRLNIVEGTVKVFVSAILRRLDVPNRVRAAIIAYEAGLVDL